MMAMKIKYAVALLLVGLMGACGGDGDTGAKGEKDSGGHQNTEDTGVDGEEEDAEVIDETPSQDLGKACNLACNYSPCAVQDSDCDGGICVRHGELNASYCSQPCVTSCAPGYSCVEIEDEGLSVCLSDEPECGNGAVEFGEACDGEEGCSQDCLTYTEPVDEATLSGGSITEAIHDGEAQTTEGLEPTVKAHNIENWLFFSAQNYGFTYGMGMPQAGDPAPQKLLVEAGLLENVGGNTCQFNGTAMATITSYDYAAKKIAGQASFTMTCMGYCDPCAAEFPLEMSFDLDWVEGEH
ncbi:hypothetical protein [Bradymonas sediminis]|nr:hypothetical protein [Bradymonas sediminis]TDP72193.1 hypothetical protein DFR33_107175 [Bradymonas sediminis]